MRPVRRPFLQITQILGMGILQLLRKCGLVLEKLGAHSKGALDLQEKSGKCRNSGQIGEEIAASYLADKGFKIVGRNVRYKFGEIDIIASRSGELHFFEVKARGRGSLIDPLEAITESKRKRIRRAAEAYLVDFGKNFRDMAIPACYFSVISIVNIDGDPELECILDAFQ